MRAKPVAAVLGILAACWVFSPSFAGDPVDVSLVGPDEPGERLRFSGRILDMDGRPLAKAAVIAYNADRNGLYKPQGSATRVPRLRGVSVTDDDGRFAFFTVRPGGYPNSDVPSHIHLILSAPAHHERHVEIWFDDDPRVGEDERREAKGNSSVLIVDPKRGEDGVWSFTCEIRLEGN